MFAWQESSIGKLLPTKFKGFVVTFLDLIQTWTIMLMENWAI